MAAGIDIRNEATPALNALPAVLRREVLPALGAAVVQLFQEHFAARPSNENNWPTTNFWQRAVRATNYNLLADGVQINVSQQGVLQRWKGGVINAKPGSWLTIPARQEAYGRRAREFSNLHFVFFRADLAALVENQSQEVSFGRQRKDGSRKVTPGEERGGGVFYWLKKSVRQDADPTVIPSTFEIAAVCFSTINGIVERALARGGRG